MARSVKEEEYAVKRNEILDVARRIIYTKGYEQMTIRDILDDLKISKGAFYHYFESKEGLLDALVTRIGEEAIQLLTPIVEAPTLSAIEKLQRYFATAGQWKTAQQAFVLALVRTWYTDQNAIVRQKQQAALLKRVTPLVAAIVRQGVEEGVFTSAYPDVTSEIIFALVLSLGDAWAELLLADEPAADAPLRIERKLAAYTDALERVLGTPSGSLHLVDAKMLKAWVPSANGNAKSSADKANGYVLPVLKEEV